MIQKLRREERRRVDLKILIKEMIILSVMCQLHIFCM